MAKKWDQYDTLKAWADIVIERWEYRVSQLDVVDTGALLRSFQAQVVTDANGNGEKIVFAYEYYGRFVELGVGKGVKVGTPSNRKQKPWYTKIFFGQVNQLAKIMAEKYGQKAVLGIVEEISLQV